MNIKHFVRALIGLFLLVFLPAKSQIQVGEWRDHLPYSHGQKVIYGDNKVYCITTGGFFYYDISDNSVNRLSKVQGLSDVGLSAGCWSDQHEILVLGYVNGNIDLISNNIIYNIPDLEQKQMTGDKSIYEIKCYGNLAYLSCGFGVIVVDILKREVKDTYRIGEGNREIKVNSVASHEGLLYTATDEGLYKADISSNLLDSRNWVRILNIANSEGAFSALAIFNNKIYVVAENNALYSQEESGWAQRYQLLDKVYSLKSYADKLLIVTRYKLLILNSQYELINSIALNEGRDVLFYDNTYWFASYVEGLVQVKGNSANEGIYPAGPWFSEANDIEISNNIVWIGSGSRSNKWGQQGSYTFLDGEWINHNYNTDAELAKVYNQCRVAINPNNSNIVYAASYGYGLVEYNNLEITNVYGLDNSPLQSAGDYGFGYINIDGICFDGEDRLWVLTSIVEHPLAVLFPNGDWYTFDIGYGGFGIDQRLEDLIITSDGYKCFLLTGGDNAAVYGIFVFDNQGEFDNESIRYKYIPVRNQDNEDMGNVYSIKEDLDGNIWVGTSKGPIVYYNFHDLFNEEVISKSGYPLGNQIIIPRNDGTMYGDPLLGASAITAIDIDGANRKWFGTAGAGVFLISPDGMKQIHNFTSTNFPMFSNIINDIAINQDNGEVFFATDKGVLSYRSDATAGDDEFKDVYVFPNPVRENYDGDVVITGLAKNANVKITDIGGNLVFETTALGGQAIWNGKTFGGDRVHTGVYLVFCTNEDATKTHITKLLFIN